MTLLFLYQYVNNTNAVPTLSHTTRLDCCPSSVRGHIKTSRRQKLPKYCLTPKEKKGIEYDVSNRYRWSGHYINNLFKDRLPFERYIKCVNRLVTKRHHTPCILCGNQCQNEDNYLTLRANTVNSLPDRRLYYNVCENCSDRILRDKSSHAHCHCNSACTICLKTNGYYPSESGIGCYCPKGYDEPCIACKHTIEIWMGKEAMKHGAFPWHYWCLFQSVRPPNADYYDLYCDRYWPMDNPDPCCDDPLYHRNCTCVHFYNTHYHKDYRECNDGSRKEDHYSRKKSGKKRHEKNAGWLKIVKRTKFQIQERHANNIQKMILFLLSQFTVNLVLVTNAKQLKCLQT